MEPPVAKKRCSKCRASKFIDDFGADGRHNDGHQSACIACMNESRRLPIPREPSEVPIPPVTTPIVRWPTATPVRLHPRQYQAMLSLQTGVCAGCGQPETVVDSQGRVLPLSLYGNATADTVVRVLLCKMCTMSMSCGRDDPGILGRLASLAAGGVRQEVRVHVDDARD